MNDPNGMVYYEGEYHLFYQHYPDSTVWGPMHWGHAVSTDMIHWEHLPIALYPDEHGYIFSGSAVIDWNNSSGLGENGKPPMVAIFTFHDPEGAKAGTNTYQTQGIAYSNDKGRSWTMYEGNPVLGNPGLRDFRDPKVSWHEPSQRWVMILAVGDHMALYNSPDLKNWTHLSDFGQGVGAHGGVWECPDLFALEVEGTSQKKWVMLASINPGGPNGGSATQYFVGEFDGQTFTREWPADPKDSVWVDYGKDNYAGVTWSDIPPEDGRRLFLGWMGNWQYAQVVPTEKWRSAMTLPRVLSLHPLGEKGYVLRSEVVAEARKLRTNEQSLPAQGLTTPLQLQSSSPPLELFLSIQLPPAEALAEVTLSNAQGEQMVIGYDGNTQHFFVDRTQSGDASFSEDFAGRHIGPRYTSSDTLSLHLFVDVASVEVFADDGSSVMTEICFPSVPYDQIQVHAQGGKLLEGKLWQLKSIWHEE